LFIANGIAEYSRAVEDEKYWHKAKQILFKCVRVYDRSDYCPQVAPSHLGPGAPPMPGARALATWMVVLRLVTQMLNHKYDGEIEAVADRCLDAIFNYHYHPQYDLMNEILNHDMSRPKNEYADLFSMGHAIETMWMVMYEAHRRKDKKLFDKAARIFKRHLEVAWDDVYGGVYMAVKNLDQNIWDLRKGLWAQEEVLIGLLFVIEHTGAQWAKDWFAKMFTYVQDKFPLRQYGFPIWILYADRKVTFERHAARVGNFHHPRHLMLNLLGIERMIRRDGKISDYFS